MRWDIRRLEFGNKQRFLNPKEKKLFSGIGGLFCEDEDGGLHHMGTGFITARSKQHILTNAHVLRPQPPERCRGPWYSPTKFLSPHCGELYNISDSVMLAEDSYNGARDVGIAKLEKPLCAGAVGLPTKIISDVDYKALFQGGVMVVSTYSVGKLPSDQLAQFVKSGSVFQFAGIRGMSTAIGYGKLGKILTSTDDYQLEHTVDTGSGSSGSPMVAEWPDGLKVFGLHTGSEGSEFQYNWGVSFSKGLNRWLDEQLSK